MARSITSFARPVKSSRSQRRSGDGDVDLHDFDVDSRRRGPASRCVPTAATSGEVNTTCGTCPWSADAVNRDPSSARPSARAAITSPQTRRLVLAHVGERRATVDVADGVEPLARVTEVIVGGRRTVPSSQADARQAEIGRRRRAPGRDDDLVGDARSRPGPGRRGCTGPPWMRPIAGVPGVGPLDTAGPRCRTGSARPSRRVTRPPARRRTVRLTSAAHAAHQQGQLVDAERPATTSRTREATTPPPMTATRRGTSWRLVASRDVHGSASRRPGVSGPRRLFRWRARRRAGRAVRGSVDRHRAFAVIRAGRGSRRFPRTSAHIDLRRIVVVVGERVAAGQHGVDVERCRPDTPGSARAASRTSPGRSSALLGMQAQ